MDAVPRGTWTLIDAVFVLTCQLQFSSCSISLTMASPSSASSSSSSSTVTAARPCTYVYTESARLPNLECLGYYLGKTLGCGTYAKVKAAWNITTSKLIAVKILNKNAASREYLEKFLPREIDILRKVHHHANILHCYQIIETEHQAIFIMELADNGDLLDYINSRRHIPEPESRCIFRQITNAVQFLHSNGVAHRDLKCENILLGHNMEVKLGDFGFAMDMVNPASTPCGSYSYAAPELFELGGTSYDPQRTDAWSIGVILYAMVCGRLPFGDDTKVKTLLKTDLIFTRPISTDCRCLLDGILNPSPTHRLTVTDMLLHSWTASAPVHLPTKLSEYPKYTPVGTLHRHTIDYIRRQSELKSRSQVAPMDYLPPYHPPTPSPSPTPRLPTPYASSRLSQGSAKQSHNLVARLGSYKRRLAEVVRRKSHDKQN